MSDPVRVVLVGIGGYGNNYVRALLDESAGPPVVVAGAIEPNPTACGRLAELQARGMVLYPSLEAFYAADRADLAIIAAPIQFHAPLTCTALAHGSNVLCEKPTAATIDEVTAMRVARDRADRFVAIGYQWSFAAPILQLKADIQAGLFGAPRRLKSLVLWPRTAAYYGRNNWAGRIRDNQGRWVFDSVANNATAHYLHNMFYLLGAAGESALPVDITAELYRANAIENFDTVAARAHTSTGVEVLFYAAHPVPLTKGPIFSFEFARASVTYGLDPRGLVARFADGGEKIYGPINDREAFSRKVWDCVAATQGGATPICGLETALAHTLCIHGMHLSTPRIHNFAAAEVRITGEPQLTWVEGLQEALTTCFEEGRLPAEKGCAWARAAATVKLELDALKKGT